MFQVSYSAEELQVMDDATILNLVVSHFAAKTEDAHTKICMACEIKSNALVQFMARRGFMGLRRIRRLYEVTQSDLIVEWILALWPELKRR